MSVRIYVVSLILLASIVAAGSPALSRDYSNKDDFVKNCDRIFNLEAKDALQKPRSLISPAIHRES